MNFYNEIDPFAAAWLRELIKAGHIAPGVVDTRSIEDITPDELRGYTQCHFFAGIGVWSYALRRAGWPDDEPVWTGSCPCQPFSSAGKRTGTADERHLWPAFFHLISECRPRVVFGEQVDAAVRQGWLDLVQTDMEGIGYTFAAAGIPACGVGAPHIRQRLYFVAHTAGRRRTGSWPSGTPQVGQPQPGQARQLSPGLEGRGVASNAAEWLADTDEERHQRSGSARDGWCGSPHHSELCGVAQGDTEQPGLEGLAGHEYGGDEPGRLDTNAAGSTAEAGSVGVVDDANRVGRKRESGEGPASLFGKALRTSGTLAVVSTYGATPGNPTGGFWRDADWIYCRDEKYRPVEPGTFPLAHGAAARVGRLRGYGNAIVAPCAEAFITAAMHSMGEHVAD